jgi:hypothetical protein
MKRLSIIHSFIPDSGDASISSRVYKILHGGYEALGGKETKRTKVTDSFYTVGTAIGTVCAFDSEGLQPFTGH